MRTKIQATEAFTQMPSQAKVHSQVECQWFCVAGLFICVCVGCGEKQNVILSLCAYPDSEPLLDVTPQTPLSHRPLGLIAHSTALKLFVSHVRCLPPAAVPPLTDRA